MRVFLFQPNNLADKVLRQASLWSERSFSISPLNRAGRDLIPKVPSVTWLYFIELLKRWGGPGAVSSSARHGLIAVSPIQSNGTNNSRMICGLSGMRRETGSHDISL